jgi:hypothetical protein
VARKDEKDVIEQVDSWPIICPVAGKECGWDIEPIANMRDGIAEESKRKGIQVQYFDVSLYGREKPICYPIDCDECEARKECSES